MNNSGAKWVVIDMASSQLLRVVFTIILTRILFPEDFGLFIKVIAIVSLLEVLINKGIGMSIIREKRSDPDRLSTLFWIYVLGSLFLILIFWLISPLIVTFYNDNNIYKIYFFCLINILFVSLTILPENLLRKSLDFKSIFKINLISTLISGVLAIVMAINGYNVYSLVVQLLLFNLLRSLLMLITSNFVPGFHLKLKPVFGNLKFGAKLFGNDMLTYLSRNADNLLIARNLGDQQLGYYNRAYTLMHLPVTQLGQFYNRFLYPVFMKIIEDRDKLQNLFISTQKFITVIYLPALLTLFVLSEDFILVLFGKKWAPSIEIFRIFMLLSTVQSFSAINSLIFVCYNKVSLSLTFNLITKPLLIILIWYVSSFGIYDVALGLTIFMILSSLYLFIRSLSLIGLNIFEVIKKLFLELFLMVIYTSILYILKNQVQLQEYLLYGSTIILISALYFYYFRVHYNRIADLMNLFR